MSNLNAEETLESTENERASLVSKAVYLDLRRQEQVLVVNATAIPRSVALHVGTRLGIFKADDIRIPNARLKKARTEDSG